MKDISQLLKEYFDADLINSIIKCESAIRQFDPTKARPDMNKHFIQEVVSFLVNRNIQNLGDNIEAHVLLSEERVVMALAGTPAMGPATQSEVLLVSHPYEDQDAIWVIVNFNRPTNIIGKDEPEMRTVTVCLVFGFTEVEKTEEPEETQSEE